MRSSFLFTSVHVLLGTQSDVDSHRTAGARTRLCTLRRMSLCVLQAASHPLRVTMLRPGEARRRPPPSSPILPILPHPPFDILSIAGPGGAHLVWMRSLLRQPRPASWSGALVRHSGVSGRRIRVRRPDRTLCRQPLRYCSLAYMQPCVHAGTVPELSILGCGAPERTSRWFLRRAHGVGRWTLSSQRPATSIGWRALMPRGYFTRCMLWRLWCRSCASRSTRRCSTRRPPD